MSINNQQAYIESLNGELTPEQAAKLLEMASDEDISALSGAGQHDSVSTTEHQAAVAANSESGVEAKTDTPQYTPDYQTLAQEHELKAQALQSQNEALARELEALKAASPQSSSPSESHPSAAAQATAQALEQGVDVSLFGDFSEEAMTKGLSELAQRSVVQLGAQMREEIRAEMMGRIDRLEAKVTPIDEQREADATQAHYRAILDKHPDAGQIVGSKELNDWLSAQPEYLKAGYGAVLNEGSAVEVNDVLDRFKRESGIAQAPADTNMDALRSAANAKAQQAKPSVPLSLSDIPGARPPTDPNDVLRSQTGAQLVESFAGKTPEQINALLNQL